MSKEKDYLSNRVKVFNECDINPNDKRFNCHHIYEKNDKKRHLLPKDFQINNRCNLIPLPIEIHNELHEIMDNTKEFKKNINTRVYLANMAFIGELDLIPQRLYYSDPRDMMRKIWNGDK